MMRKEYIHFALFIGVILLITGCQTTRGKVTYRAYIQEKQRVDQEVSGTVGNWQNAPMAEDVERKKTRKMYVLEVSQDADDAPYDEEFFVIDSSDAATSNMEESIKSAQKKTSGASKIDLPSFDDELSDGAAQEEKGPTTYVEYKVQKDDTLQKISNKFYNSYSKWPRIYEANKAKIKNPDFIKPGIVIRIPME